MKLNRAKLINVLCNIDNINLIKKRDWNNIYKNKTINYWNNLLWEKILDHKSINGTGIDKYEFYNFCGYYCTKEESGRIFNIINTKSRCILFSEFDDFLLHLDDNFYNSIIDCLEGENLENLENNNYKTNLHKLLLEDEITQETQETQEAKKGEQKKSLLKINRPLTPLPKKKIENNVENNIENNIFRKLYFKLKVFLCKYI